MDPKKLFVCVGAAQRLARFSSVGCFCIYETRLSHLSTFTSIMKVQICVTYRSTVRFCHKSCKGDKVKGDKVKSP